jgi:hypothetical protein
MKTTSMILCALLCALPIAAGPARGEDLYVIGCGTGDCEAADRIDGVSVYGTLRGALLVGAEGARAGRALEGAFGKVRRIGERSPAFDYYFFRAAPGGLDALPGGVELLWFDGRDAIVRADAGIPFVHPGAEWRQGLTRISFTPRARPGRARPLPPDIRGIDPVIAAIAAEVSEAEYSAYDRRLEAFVTRYVATDSCRAAEQWALDTFASMGLETELFPYSYHGNRWFDPIGRKTGTLHPDSVYIVIAHIDATSEDPAGAAPGAEDNGSGSACVLEAARVLSGHDFDCTLEFVLASGEELGLLGSEAYARYCYNEGRNIAGVLNFDMIAYTGADGWDTNIYADRNSPAEAGLADLLAGMTALYSSAVPVRVETDGPFFGSDHYYFSFYGYPAPFSIDAQLWGAPDWYPWYHTSGDLSSHLDFPFATEVVRGAVATLAALASPSEPPALTFSYPDGLPERINPGGGTAFRVEIGPGTGTPVPGTGLLYVDSGAGFAPVPMTEIVPNVYDAVFPGVACGGSVSFYLSAETAAGGTVLDPASAPAGSYGAAGALERVTIYADDFAFNRGWQGLGGPGEWAIGEARGGHGIDTYGSPDPADDHSPSPDGRLLGTDLSSEDGDYDARLGGPYRVTSPVIDCSDYFGTELRFFRWLGVGGNAEDRAEVEVYDGAAWVTIEANGPAVTDDAGWRERSYDVSAQADGNPAFRIRFGIGPTDAGWEYCGWNVDDLELTGFTCATPPDVGSDPLPDDVPAALPPVGP